ncbi:uncharacterized protein LOC123721874 isoform X1 [Papilio machaon]|uniref:uncharacterized protein LOC106708857 n=2 Tax=Papilio machaon TaxID=76193 RepID=UPI0006EAD7ED|nr:uncharacterized protein LOC106708857 [Papilio machaon]XP_045534726.1 uncharacterized protein LOC123721151 isoform X2 [Papilio machaon]XP_045535976.1 uncharacterized protein LOC123721391 isoform X2 [Papilio machaon]XP_045537824.1 uncharacterized protein LOC123721874 isoform X1 [Papilio machaon]
MTDDKLTKLKQKRGCIKTKVTIFSKYLKQLVSGGQPSKLQLLDLEGRFKKFDALYAHFDNLQCEIEMLSDDPSVSELEREEFEAGYHPLVAEARRLLGAQPQDTSVIQLEDAQIFEVFQHLQYFNPGSMLRHGKTRCDAAPATATSRPTSRPAAPTSERRSTATTLATSDSTGNGLLF